MHPADRDRISTVGTPSEATDSETLSDQESERGNGTRKPRIMIGRLDGSVADVDDGDGEDNELDESDDGDDGSPIAELGQFDWGSADDELEMFLAEGDDDDDDEESRQDSGEYDSNNASEDGDENGDGVPPASKRKMGEESDAESDRSASRGRGLTAKRQRLRGMRSRSTSKLRTVATPGSEVNNGHPLRQLETQTTEDSSDQENKVHMVAAAGNGKLGAMPAGMDVDDDDLEAMLMAELDEEEAAAAAEANG